MRSNIGIVAAAAAASIFPLTVTAQRLADSLFDYTFRRTECLSGYARDSNTGAAVFGDLNINTSAVTCKGLGVEAKSGASASHAIMSSLDSSRFAEEINLGDDGWTFEVWATFANFSDCPSCQRRHMAHIGTNETFKGDACLPNANFFFLQQNSDNYVAIEGETVDASCYSIPAASAIDWGVPVHIVFTSTTWVFGRSSMPDDSFLTTRWFFNGLLVRINDQRNMLKQWQDGFYLQMMHGAGMDGTKAAEYASPGGTTFLVAMYNWPLNDSQVMQNFNAGLEDSPPVAEDITVTINEDGEIGDHYDTPDFYLQNPTVHVLSLPVVYLQVTDVDQQEGFPGFNAEQEQVFADVFISSLPRGTLFDIDGQMITKVPHHVTFNGGYPVRYRPEKDESSGPSDIYTSFTYAAADGVTGEVSVVHGVVDIHVLPKNDPPMSRNVTATVSTGETTIFLNGTDVDSLNGDTIQGASIATLPTHGVLHQVFDNETRSDVEMKSGDRLSGQYVSYTYTDNVTRTFDTPSEGTIAYDSFAFRLYDSFGAWSTLGIASLAIISRLTAVTTQSRNDSSWICVEDTTSPINVYAEDSETRRRKVSIVISVVPQHGTLLRATANSTLMPGDTLDTNCTNTNDTNHITCVSSLTYLPDMDYFNSPTSKWNGDEVGGSLETEAFSFYAVASENGEYSNEVVQDLRVINSNDPSIVQCPKQVQQVGAVGTSVYTRGAVFDPLDSTAIEGVTIADLDKGVDVVKVKIFANFGLLSLNQSYVSILDFNSAAFCYEADDSQCVGSGTGDRELVFFAEPNHAQMALDGMVYQSMVSNVVDTIKIIVLDGANGECLSETKFLSGSVQQGCWQASCQFNITVGSRQLALDVASNNSLSAEVWISVGIGSFVLGYIACRRLLCWRS